MVLPWKIKHEWLGTKRPSDYAIGPQRAVTLKPMTQKGGARDIAGTYKALGIVRLALLHCKIYCTIMSSKLKSVHLKSGLSNEN